MKRNLNEQITRIKNMMGLNEHMDFDTPEDDYSGDEFGKFDPDYFEDSEEGFNDKINQNSWCSILSHFQKVRSIYFQIIFQIYIYTYLIFI